MKIQGKVVFEGAQAATPVQTAPKAEVKKEEQIIVTTKNGTLISWLKDNFYESEAYNLI